MLTIGLTGGVGSGKSTVSRHFASLGVPVIDADEVSRQLVEKGEPAYIAIIEKFGRDILTEEGELDRRKLRDLIFRNSHQRVALEGILHPLIRQEIQLQIQKLDAPYCIIAIPLLIETGQTDIVDRILVINAARDVQIQRTVARDRVTPTDVEAIMATQVAAEVRLSMADDVLNNDGDLEALESRVEELHNHYLEITGTEKLAQNPENVEYKAESEINVLESSTPTNVNLLEPRENMRTTSVQLSVNQTENIYELPLNEKTRTLIRLEFLFSEIDHFLAGSSIWDVRSAVNAFLATLSLVTRPELKTDLMKELDRINTSLAKFNSREGVNSGALEEIQSELTEKLRSIRNMDGQLGYNLKKNELINSLRQRETIPGGALAMDMPAYAHWLNQSFDQCKEDILSWLTEFTLVKKSVDLILSLIRDSAVANDTVAKMGFYQHTLDSDVSHQIVRVVLPKGVEYFPEISGGRHRFTVRFLKPCGIDRPVQAEEDVSFKLICCAL